MDDQKTIMEICAQDERFAKNAYFFMLEALEFTFQSRDKDKETQNGAVRHVSGAQLLGGIRTFTLQQFGPMASTVLREWGLRRTEDFGAIVFNLIKAGRLQKSEDDSLSDFADGFDFYETFEKPFLPPSRQQAKPQT